MAFYRKHVGDNLLKIFLDDSFLVDFNNGGSFWNIMLFNTTANPITYSDFHLYNNNIIDIELGRGNQTYLSFEDGINEFI